jgi:murein DD-endopeptidase MepM/ murein hydrolase activator NlpD
VTNPWRTRATFLALSLALLWPAGSEAKPKHKSATKPAPSTKPKAAKPSYRNPVHEAAKANRPAKKTGKKKRAKRVIRQDAGNQVVLDWIQARRPRETFGPFLPPGDAVGPFLPTLEAFDYPPAPCQPVDVILEAHLHDESPDTPEAEASEEVARSEMADARVASAESFLTVAKRIGSFLRPKSAEARVSAEDVDLGDLLNANLRIPVEGVDAIALRDSFLDRRGRYRKHLAIDIGAPRGTPILATADGEIVRLRREKRGGITIYQKDASGKYLFFYCHLSRYVRGLAVGQRVAAGEVIGYVGSTGHVIGGPHLHFSITRVPEDDDVKAGLAINPYLLFLAGMP